MPRTARRRSYLCAALALAAAFGDTTHAQPAPAHAGVPADAGPPAATRAPGAAPAARTNIVIVGWDGVQRDHFFECYRATLPGCPDGLPAIERLSGGRIHGVTVTTAKTCTKPGWVEILTGYDAASLGIIDNSRFRPVPAGYSLLEKAEAALGPERVVTAFIAGKSGHVGGNCGVRPRQPWCLVKGHIDHYRNALGRNAAVGERALRFLEDNRDRRMVAFFHFAEPDEIGHRKGESSPAYTAALRDDDVWLGRIVGKLEELGIRDRTYVYVVTDHGYDEGQRRHMNAPYGILASDDPLVRRSGDRKDLAPTILKRLGIPRDGSDGTPPVAGRPLDELPSACVPEGEPALDNPGAPTCCAGLVRIGLDDDRPPRKPCFAPTGGSGDTTGYCTHCGDGTCAGPENRCNCPADCRPARRPLRAPAR